MKFTRLKIKIILIEDEHKIERSVWSADLRFASKKRWRYFIGYLQVWVV